MTAAATPRATVVMTARERHELTESAIQSIVDYTARRYRLIYAGCQHVFGRGRGSARDAGAGCRRVVGELGEEQGGAHGFSHTPASARQRSPRSRSRGRTGDRAGGGRYDGQQRHLLEARALPKGPRLFQALG